MQRTRGYALVLVMGIALMLTIGVGTMLSFLASAQKTSARQRLNREAFYVCDGVARALSRVTSDVLGTPGIFTPSDDEGAALSTLREKVVERVGETATMRPNGSAFAKILPPNYEEDGDGFAFTYVDATESSGVVRAGRFTDLSGQRRHFAFNLALRKVNGSGCSTSTTIDSMRIPFGEFAVFADEALRICPSWTLNDVTRTARYHVNGDLTIGNVALPRTTIVGSLSVGCAARNAASDAAGGLGSSTGLSGANGLAGNAIELASSIFSLPAVDFCVGDGNCLNTNTLATSSTNTSVLSSAIFSDARRGTSSLHPPEARVRVQNGRNATNGDAASNDGSFRYLVDPGFDDETGAATANRLAHLALVRILDGVWYLNDGSPWPGLPIWSDHPGSFSINTTSLLEEQTLHNGPRDVGRADVITSGSQPDRYSWYDDADDATTTARGVVSYGRLVRDGGRHRPGSVVESGSATPRQRALAAATDGFVDRHGRQSATARGNVYPLNFDLGQFVEALLDTESNELRGRINDLPASSTRDVNRVIVWIGSTWPGSLRGLTNDETAAALPEYDGDVLERVPHPLCQRLDEDEGGEGGGEGGGGGPESALCGDEDDDNARINAVRVINAATQLPDGLRITIATPLPLYVLGSVDRTPAGSPQLEPPTGIPGRTLGEVVAGSGAGAGPDVFFAADAVTLVSDGWNNDGWGAVSVAPVPDVTRPVVVNASILTGRTVSGSSFFPFGLERAVRFLERWPANSANNAPVVAGSILVGFSSVFAWWPVCYNAADADCEDDSPWRHFWSSKLMSDAGQPPGMPAFTLRGIGETVPDSQRFDFLAYLDSLDLLAPAFEIRATE
jgi:hypothetical protein